MNLEFRPHNKGEKSEPSVPYLEDVRAEDGWQGHSTDKSYEKLKGEILNELERLNARVTRWARGSYEIDGEYREAIEISYEVRGPKGSYEGLFRVAALPRRQPFGGKKHHDKYDATLQKWHEESLRMAMFNVVAALIANRNLQQLSPGYAALIPWLLAGDTGKTVGELWAIGSKALPAPADDGGTVDAEFREVGEEKGDE